MTVMTENPVESRAREIFEGDAVRCRRFLEPGEMGPRYDALPPHIQQTYLELATRELAWEWGAA
jgi:hypothetical protein